MVSTQDAQTLSRLQIATLARLSGSKPVNEEVLLEDVLELFAARSDAVDGEKQKLLESLSELRDRGLAATNKRNRKGIPLWKQTADGARALRAALDVSQTPKWLQVRDSYLPALALGLPAGSKQAAKSLSKADSIAATVLRTRLGIREASTVNDLCDVLVTEALGLSSGSVSLPRIRAHLLAMRAGIEPKPEPVTLATAFVAQIVDAEDTDKEALTKALARRWVRESDERPAEAALQPIASDRLLALVRDAVPQIGAKGRYGREKVFVSAIWHRVAHDHRLAGLSLDRFKHWLLEANRDGLLVLARADLVAAMNPELVAESEIEDRGATFHFVLDHRDGDLEAERETHAR